MLAGMARLFFALWPDDALCRQVAAQAVALQHAHEGGGRLQSHERLHLTLRFLGAFDGDALEAAVDAATRAGNATTFAPFEFALDRAASFGRATWWLGTGNSQPLRDLRARLDLALAEAGFGAAQEAFVPHVTIVRDALRPLAPSPIATLPWQVRGFALVESRAGRPYRFLRDWTA